MVNAKPYKNQCHGGFALVVHFGAGYFPGNSNRGERMKFFGNLLWLAVFGLSVSVASQAVVLRTEIVQKDLSQPVFVTSPAGDQSALRLRQQR